MKVRLSKEYSFDSAHKLPWHKGKCQYLHGHTYKLRVTVEGKLNQNGIIIDFGDLKAIVNKHVVDVLDHKFLNDIFVNPTAEMMAKGIFNTIKKYLPEGVKLCMVELWETPTSKAIVIP